MFVSLSGWSVYSTEFFGAVSLSWSLFDVFKKGNETRNSAFFSQPSTALVCLLTRLWVIESQGVSEPVLGCGHFTLSLCGVSCPESLRLLGDALHEHFSFFGWILSVWRECISCISYHIQMEEFRNFVLIRTYFQKRFTLKERCRY